MTDGQASNDADDVGSVVLYWLPLGAGGHSVRWSGRVFEAFGGLHRHRPVRDLYHSALEVRIGVERFVIEMTPVWVDHVADRGVVQEGPSACAGLAGLPCFATRFAVGATASSRIWRRPSGGPDKSATMQCERDACGTWCR